MGKRGPIKGMKKEIEPRELEIGEVLTYAEICDCIEQPRLAGNQKKQQLNRFAYRYQLEKIKPNTNSRNCKYKVMGINFDEKIPDPITEEERQLTKNYIYGVLLNYMHRQSFNVSNCIDGKVYAFMSVSDSPKLTGFFNEWYGTHDQIMLDKLWRLHPFLTKDIIKRVNKRGKDRIKATLELMSSEHNITHRFELQVISCGEHFWHSASIAEQNDVDEAMRICLDEFDLENDRGINFLGQKRKAAFDKMFIEEKLKRGITSTRKALCLCMSLTTLKEEIEKHRKKYPHLDTSLETFVRKLNIDTINLLRKQTVENIQKRKIQFDDESFPDNNDLIRYWKNVLWDSKDEEMIYYGIRNSAETLNKYYTEINEELINVLVSITSERIFPSVAIEKLTKKNNGVVFAIADNQIKDELPDYYNEDLQEYQMTPELYGQILNDDNYMI